MGHRGEKSVVERNAVAMASAPQKKCLTLIPQCDTNQNTPTLISSGALGFVTAGHVDLRGRQSPFNPLACPDLHAGGFLFFIQDPIIVTGPKKKLDKYATMWQKISLFTPHWCQASENSWEIPTPIS
jgi:hypothetical protein